MFSTGFYISSNPTLTPVSVPYTATRNLFFHAFMSNSGGSYLFLHSEKFGRYYAAMGNANHTNAMIVPVVKGDTISVQTNASSPSYAVLY